MQRKSQSIARAVFPYLLIVLGVLSIAASAVQQLRAQRTAGWPTTEARIVQTEIQTESARRDGVSYKPRVQYEYTVNGTRHVGSKLSHSIPTSRSRDSIQSVLDRHQVGSTVLAHYNPDQPSESVLDNSRPSRALNWAIGFVFIVVGAALLAANKRRQSHERASIEQPAQ